MAAKKKVSAFVLKAYRSVYKGKETDAQILRIDPNTFDRDPAEFFDRLSDEYRVEGLRGTVAEIIDLIVARTKAGPFPYPLVMRLLEALPYAPNANAATLDQQLIGPKRMETAHKAMKKRGAPAKDLELFKPELTLLQSEARQALDSEDYDRIVEHARRRKVEDIDATVVKRILEHISKAR